MTSNDGATTGLLLLTVIAERTLHPTRLVAAAPLLPIQWLTTRAPDRSARSAGMSPRLDHAAPDATDQSHASRGHTRSPRGSDRTPSAQSATAVPTPEPRLHRRSRAQRSARDLACRSRGTAGRSSGRFVAGRRNRSPAAEASGPGLGRQDRRRGPGRECGAAKALGSNRVTSARWPVWRPGHGAMRRGRWRRLGWRRREG
jgi:hypothetical protein